MSDIQARIADILRSLSERIYDKHTEISLSLLAALSGESILLLGPPGVAKSMIARRLKEAFAGARSFEYLMSRFSTPDEIFGPVSISKLKTSDKFERATDGFLPTADVVFLDEIWKAGPAIQNTLLTVMNEKLFRNGERELQLPLKLLVAASNELPAKGEGLEALWDRFLVRIICHCITDETVFRTMICDTENSHPATPATNLAGITNEEYAQWQKEALSVKIPKDVLEAITVIRRQLQNIDIEGSDLKRNVYISDRRWRHIATLLRTSAYVQGRSEVWLADLIPICHCLWNEPEEIPAVRNIVFNAIFSHTADKLHSLSQRVKSDLNACGAQKALSKALRENDHRDENLFIADRFFYQIENHGTGHSFVFITDFKQLPQHQPHATPTAGVIYSDPSQKERKIVRILTPEVENAMRSLNAERVTLCRDNSHIFINGIAFKMREQGRAVLSPSAGRIMGNDTTSGTTASSAPEGFSSCPVTSTNYEKEADDVCDEIEQMEQQTNANLFASVADRKEIQGLTQTLYRQVALCRVDIRKLLYNDE